ncbi:MAG TPA: hypothetical protein VIT68_01615 [Candidatus Gracilibacteria bacterium]
MNKLSHSVLERIKKEQIQPRSKWYFLFKSLLIGIFSIVFVILGLIACTMIFQFLEHIMILEMLWKSPYVFLKLLWLGIPLFWLVSWVGLFGFGTFLAHESKHGYKIAWRSWVILILSIQILGGFALYESHVGDRIDQFMGQLMRRYERAETRGNRMWRNPENGFLGGAILDIQETSITLKDRAENEWTVDITSAHRPEALTLEIGTRVRLTGEKTSEANFKADMINLIRGGERRQGPPPTREEREIRRKEREEAFKALSPELQEKLQEKREEAQGSIENNLLDRRPRGRRFENQDFPIPKSQ